MHKTEGNSELLVVLLRLETQNTRTVAEAQLDTKVRDGDFSDKIVFSRNRMFQVFRPTSTIFEQLTFLCII